jgi:hypothetical protein
MCTAQHGYFSMNPKEHTNWLIAQAKQTTQNTAAGRFGLPSMSPTAEPSVAATDTMPKAPTMSPQDARRRMLLRPADTSAITL